MTKNFDTFLSGWYRRGQVTKSKKNCGNCKHTDNDMGVFALWCDLLPRHDDLNKVRSWNACAFKPSKWEKRKSRWK